MIDPSYLTLIVSGIDLIINSIPYFKNASCFCRTTDEVTASGTTKHIKETKFKMNSTDEVSSS